MTEFLNPTPSAGTLQSYATGIPPGFSRRRAAIIAGLGYVLLFALAIFANFVVREGLVVPGDAMTTAANIQASEGLFRIGLVAFLVIFLLDVFVAWGLHIVFRIVDRDVSLLAAWFRIVYTVFMGVALVYFFQALQYLGNESFLQAFEPAQRHAQALVALDSFNSIWLIGLAAFGIHLILVGCLILRSAIAPRILGVILAISGIAYVVDTAAHSLMQSYAEYAGVFVAMVAIPAVIAEGWFGIWLLVKAAKN